MKGIAVSGFGVAPELRADLPAPTPGEKDVLVRVRASSVNPVDARIAGGMLQGMFEHEFPVVLGRDHAGVVEQVGRGVTRYPAGEDVFGFVLHADPTIHDGSWAELIVLPEASIGRAPAGVDVAAVGAAPLAGIAAMGARWTPSSSRTGARCSSSARPAASAACSRSWLRMPARR